MTLIKTEHGYNYWMGQDDEFGFFYNVTPVGQQKPDGGYRSMEWICSVKGIPK